jgi:hypothetical protein
LRRRRAVDSAPCARRTRCATRLQWRRSKQRSAPPRAGEEEGPCLAGQAAARPLALVLEWGHPAGWHQWEAAEWASRARGRCRCRCKCSPAGTRRKAPADRLSAGPCRQDLTGRHQAASEGRRLWEPALRHRTAACKAECRADHRPACQAARTQGKKDRSLLGSRRARRRLAPRGPAIRAAVLAVAVVVRACRLPPAAAKRARCQLG